MSDSKKIYEQEGERVITSGGYGDLDLESIVEPSRLAPEEIEEELDKLAVKTLFHFKFYHDGSFSDKFEKEIEGNLLRYHSSFANEVVVIQASVEDALFLANINRYVVGEKEVDFKMSYVLQNELGDLEHYKKKRVFRLDGIEFGDVERSRCVLSVKLSRVT